MTRLIPLAMVSALASLPFGSVVAAQQHPAMPPGMTHQEHMAQMKKEAEMKEHGQMAMGFDQDKATHHFTLTGTGGAISLSANDVAAQHMQTTVAAQERTGTDIPGIGSKAVGVRGASFTGGGYIISILDAKGGFGVSILGRDGTRDRAVALAKIVESHR